MDQQVNLLKLIDKSGLKNNQPTDNLSKLKKKVEVREGEKFISIEPTKNDLIIDFETFL